MNKLAKRAWFALALAGVLLLGMGVIVVRYFIDSPDWVTFQNSPHVYTDGVMNSGKIVDRGGAVVLDATNGKSYADSASLRRSMLHLLGDREGNITPFLLQEYGSELVGFDRINGTYSTGKREGRMMLTVSADVQRTALAALDEIPDILSRTFTCEGSAVIGGETIQCNGVHGTLNFEEALAHSCNVVFGEIAAELGPKTLMRYAEQVGVTRRYSFDGTTTAVGSFDVSNAAESELAWAGIGQYTDQINPCQYMTYMGAIANGGSAAEPFLVKEVTYGDSVKYKASTSSTGRLLDSTTAGRLADMMHNAVVNVYGEWNFAGLYAGGKSGTAENGGGKAANAVFAGFLQDSDYPLAFIVVVEEGGGGASVCTPILSQVLSACVVAMDAD